MKRYAKSCSRHPYRSHFHGSGMPCQRTLIVENNPQTLIGLRGHHLDAKRRSLTTNRGTPKPLSSRLGNRLRRIIYRCFVYVPIFGSSALLPYQTLGSTTANEGPIFFAGVRYSNHQRGICKATRGVSA